MKQFVHLHVHTEYSLLDGATRIDDMLARCKELNMPAVAVTDHGNMYCAWKFLKAANAAGIKPIIGCEFYMCENLHSVGFDNKEYFHLVLLAKNNTGYYNLCKLNSIAFVDGFYYKPRIDFETLQKYSEGLICLSACIAGQLPRLLLADRPEEAEELALQYKALFGEDYYIEIQRHGIEEEDAVMPQLVELARKLNIKIVVTNDVHYLNREDAEIQDVMMCVQMGKYLDDTDRMKFQGEEFYLKSYDEMALLFPKLPDAMDTTLEIADKCNVDFGKEKLLPLYTPPNNMSSPEYLRYLVDEGLKKKYPNASQEILDRIDYEYKVICDMGFVDYYLIVWDFINYAKTNGIPVGPGRGSGAGSVIAYLIGITEVEPFRFNLMFERFLNPERKSMPDFDVDFCMDRRGEVIDYVHDKYGNDNVCQIVTFGTMAAKNAIRDVARVLRVPIAESNRLAKMVPDNFKYTLKHLLGLKKYKKEADTYISEELVAAYNDPATHKLIDIAMRLEGSPRQTGMHAAGVVICREKVSDHVPLQTNGGSLAKGGIVTTQYNMIEVEELGLLKMDFLGLRTLTDIKKACDYVYEDHGVRIDFAQDNYDDQKVFELISSGDTMCIFQLESGGMCELMRKMKPTHLEEIIAGISLYRPGPMQYIGDYIDCKFDKSKIKYLHPSMESILAVTNGCIVYQEQVMQLVQKLAGFSMALADNVRYAMSKKKAQMMKDLGELFVHGGTWTNGETVPGCVKNGIPEDVALEIYKQLDDFSQYAFNKSHATCYAYVTYQTAYLKKYYPVEFICALLNNRISDISQIKKYMAYAKSQGIEVLPPDINRSRDEFRVENGAIRFGLGGIRNIGVGIVKQIVDEREANGEFKDMTDLFERCFSFINKRMVENLIKGGAFDCFNRTRADMLQWYVEELNEVSESNKKHATGQISIFDLVPEIKTTTRTQREQVKEFPKQVLYSFENEVLGVYMTGSPLDDYDDIAKRFLFDFNTSETMAYVPDGSEDGEPVRPEVAKRFVTTGGILRDIRVAVGRDNQRMAFGVLEDKYDTIEISLYGPTYEKYKNLFAEDAFVVVKGMITESRDAYKINVRELINPRTESSKVPEPTAEQPTKNITLWLKMDERDDEKYEKVMDTLRSYEGEIPVKIRIEGKNYELERRVRKCPGIEYELAGILGEKNVIFFEK
ncbi:MAG: DNA polymerase III subunit alpha [Clostridiales bacterium]|nr:DNA polymerase III subunit alpha [Clostridiales bacterium]